MGNKGDKDHMQRETIRISDEEKHQIAQAVSEAEAHTTAEIVPVVARISGRYDRAEDIVGLLCGLVLLVVVWVLFVADLQPDVASTGLSASTFRLPALIAAVLVGFFGGAVLAARFGLLRMLFIPAIEIQEDVDRRAREVFFDQRIHHTERATGIMIYVSLYERMVVILADASVTELLGQDALDGLCDELTDRLHRGEGLIESLCAVIRDAGERLHAVLPGDETNPNEVENALVILE